MGLIVGALVLTALEVFVPGGILGVCAAVCILVASYLSFQAYGLFVASVVFFASVLASVTVAIIQFRMLRHTSVGRKLFLSSTIHGHSNVAAGTDDLLGVEAQAITRLNPTGMISVAGKQYEASSRDGFIEKNQTVRVVARENFNLIIEKL
ncbi:NfeD family protein [Coraliomargarita akajimensis]|nr:NfeD family protein [Coraliomargarita akajimensis]